MTTEDDKRGAQAAGIAGAAGSLVFCVLIYIKLVSRVDIPWLWVFAPVWIPFVFFLAMVTISLGVILSASWWSRQRRKNYTLRRVK